MRPLLAPALVGLATAGLVWQGCGGSSSSRSGGGGGASPAPVPVAPGVSARDFLSDATYRHLLVEIDHVQGQAPSPAALQVLRTRLEERCNKPDGVTILVDDAIPPGSGVYSVAENRALEAQHRDHHASGTTVVLYMLYLDGRSDQDSGGARVLGWAHGPSSVGIFRESIVASANLVASSAEVEAAVLVHEAGHILGLVNNGTPMVTPHEDPDRRGHDVDERCIMHWRIETSEIRTLIQHLGSVPTQFDARCIEDLRASGGR
ncbi:MAG: hypothetical protein M9894_11430 [Planctomycetes bacterium]|nr:hypothetical protein [Planctomycetota bacterium]